MNSFDVFVIKGFTVVKKNIFIIQWELKEISFNNDLTDNKVKKLKYYHQKCVFYKNRVEINFIKKTFKNFKKTLLARL